MPDLATHLAGAHILRRVFPTPVEQALFLVGTVLPDLYAKGFKLGCASEAWFTYPTHSPTILLLECYLPALFLAEALRGRGFLALYLGGLLHLVLDTCKDHYGGGIVHWAFPWQLQGSEWGLYFPEDTIYLAPIAVAAALLVEFSLNRFRRPRTDAQPTTPDRPHPS